MKTTTNAAQTTALTQIAAGKGETLHIGTLRALARRGLVTLKVRTVKQYLHGVSTDVTVDLTDAGKAALA